jgi:hypothetical protein
MRMRCKYEKFSKINTFDGDVFIISDKGRGKAK